MRSFNGVDFCELECFATALTPSPVPYWHPFRSGRGILRAVRLPKNFGESHGNSVSCDIDPESVMTESIISFGLDADLEFFIREGFDVSRNLFGWAVLVCLKVAFLVLDILVFLGRGVFDQDCDLQAWNDINDGHLGVVRWKTQLAKVYSAKKRSVQAASHLGMEVATCLLTELCFVEPVGEANLGEANCSRWRFSEVTK